MVDIFFRSDDHLGHGNTFEKFKREDGITPLRPYTSIDEMNNDIITKHNAVVRPQDHVYFGGDVVINKKYLPLVKEMNGHKRLIMGNHDIFDIEMYLAAGFEKVMGYRVFVDKFIFSHIPLHTSNVTDRFHCNVHGHLHSNYINDPKYLCVCVEQTNYTPLHMDEVLDRIRRNEESFAQTGHIIDYRAPLLSARHEQEELEALRNTGGAVG
jgi:calcineurin-like phosphoesterase family protein